MKYIIISDLFLNKRTLEQKTFFAGVLNREIFKIKEPVVLIANGNISDGCAGIDWLYRIKAHKIIYIPGNLEFWGRDYYEHVKELKEYSQDKNITILINESIKIESNNIIGLVLWSDFNTNLDNFEKFKLGVELNIDITDDFKNIKAKHWYDDEKNVKKLKALYPTKYNLYMSNLNWNPLIQIEEFNNSVNAIKRLTDDNMNNIVVSHYPPTSKLLEAVNFDKNLISLPFRYSEDEIRDLLANNFADKKSLAIRYSTVSEAVSKVNSKLISFWLFGHLSQKVDVFIDNIRFISCPTGIPLYEKVDKISFKETKLSVEENVEIFKSKLYSLDIKELIKEIAFYKKYLQKIFVKTKRKTLEDSFFEDIVKNAISHIESKINTLNEKIYSILLNILELQKLNFFVSDKFNRDDFIFICKKLNYFINPIDCYLSGFDYSKKIDNDYFKSLIVQIDVLQNNIIELSKSLKDLNVFKL